MGGLVMEEKNARLFLAFALLLALLPACSRESADEKDSEYIRFVDEQAQGSRLEAAIATFENGEGVRVDLVAALHLADPDFYSRLNLFFKAYDAVLYELIAPADSPRPDPEREDSLVSLLQRAMCRALKLDFQLDAVDYSRPNFVHADLTAEEFMERWKARGESLWKLIFQIFEAETRAQADGKETGMDPDALLKALGSPNRAARLKYLLAQQFQDIEGFLAYLEPPEEGKESLILGERNGAAIRALEQQLALGKKKLAIFYGAGHMPDLQKRLTRDLGFHLTEKNWFTAWEIDPVE